MLTQIKSLSFNARRLNATEPQNKRLAMHLADIKRLFLAAKITNSHFQLIFVINDLLNRCQTSRLSPIETHTSCRYDNETA
jgi:hypothetical protein